MSLPKIYHNNVFEPRLQILHEQMDSVLKLLCNLSKADQVFLSFWYEEYNQICSNQQGFYETENFDGRQFENKFKSLVSEVIYVTNARLHTLTQEIKFLSNYRENTNVFLLPLINEKDRRVGVLGLTMAPEEVFDFDQSVHQIESIGKHIMSIYDELIAKNPTAHPNKVNFDQIPAFFLSFSINKNAELLDCHFSKDLIKKHPAFLNYSGNSMDMLEPLVQMDLPALTKMLLKSNNDQSIEYVYPYLAERKAKRYFLIKMRASLLHEGVYQCLAIIEDVSIHRKYNTTLDQILFDISHVMRRPVASLKGLTNLIDLNEFDRHEIYEIAAKIKVVSDEMEDYIRAMFKIYEAKQEAEYHL